MSAIDLFARFQEPTADVINASATRAFSIIPSDTNELDYVTRMLYVGTGGDISCCLVSDSKVTVFRSVPSGIVFPLRVRKVLATGTTAENIIGLL